MGELLPFRRAETTATERAEGPGSRVVPPPREVARPSGPEPLWREAAGAVLRERRHGLEQTLAQVARRAGVSVQYLSEVERGLKDPSSEILAAVSGALGLRTVDVASRALETPAQSTNGRGPGRGSYDGPVCLAV